MVQRLRRHAVRQRLPSGSSATSTTRAISPPVGSAGMAVAPASGAAPHTALPHWADPNTSGMAVSAIAPAETVTKTRAIANRGRNMAKGARGLECSSRGVGQTDSPARPINCIMQFFVVFTCSLKSLNESLVVLQCHGAINLAMSPALPAQGDQNKAGELRPLTR